MQIEATQHAHGFLLEKRTCYLREDSKKEMRAAPIEAPTCILFEVSVFVFITILLALRENIRQCAEPSFTQ